MKYFTIIPIAIYLIWVYIKYGKQLSISDSVYKLIKKNKKYIWIFIGMFLATVMPMVFIYIYNLPGGITASGIVLFLAGTAILFVPAAAKFRLSNKVNTWHVTGALLGYVLGYVFGIIRFGWASFYLIVPSLILIMFCHLYFDKKKKKYDWMFRNKELSSSFIDERVYWDEVIGLIVIYLFTW